MKCHKVDGIEVDDSLLLDTPKPSRNRMIRIIQEAFIDAENAGFIPENEGEIYRKDLQKYKVIY